MYRSRLTLSLLVSSGLVVGCSDSSPVSVEEHPSLIPPPTVNAPVLTLADLVQSTVIGGGPGPGPEGPALATFDDGGGDDYDSWSQIFDPDTRIQLDAGFVGIYGRHDYTGNVGHIRTTGQVSYNDQHLGSQTAEKQQYVPFLLDFGQTKNIWVYPKVYTDHECGLKAEGQSKHSAWWEFYQGTDVSTWGRSEVTSQANPVTQGGCSGNTDGFEVTEESSEGIVCTYWITYDTQTGAIVDAELLFCTATGGDLI